MIYKEVLSTINSFMEEAGIRQYCREKCGGDCCMFCGNDNKSFDYCHNRLQCSIYLCPGMRDILENVYPGFGVFWKRTMGDVVRNMEYWVGIPDRTDSKSNVYYKHFSDGTWDNMPIDFNFQIFSLISDDTLARIRGELENLAGSLLFGLQV